MYIQSRDKETRGALSMANMDDGKRKHRPTMDNNTTRRFQYGKQR